MSDLLKGFMDSVHELQQRAAEFPKRRSDEKLYGVLAACMDLCDRCDREGLLDDLKAEVRGRAIGRRAYFEANADAPLVIGRLIFEAEEGKRRDAAWRYTACIREARAKGINAVDLPKWLSGNGGLNALFRSRKVKARSNTTRTLHLTAPVTFESGKNLLLTLQRRPDGFIDVVREMLSMDAAE